MRPCQTILVLEDLWNVSTGPLYRKRVELSLDDSQTVKDIYLQWLLLMIDLGYLHHETLFRDAQRLWLDITKVDVLDLNNALAELLECVRIQRKRGFKALCSRISCHFYHMVRKDFQLVLDGDVYAAERLVQLFAYTSRLTLRDIDLTQQCLTDYTDTEDRIRRDSYFPKGLISSLNSIIKRWMKSFDPTRIQFRHGPGGVSGHGRVSLSVKYKDLTYDELLVYAFGEPWWCQSEIRSSLDRISSTVFVPKSYKTFRTISMEPSTLQYCQQGVWREIDRVVLKSSWLRSHIGFHDQTRNQQLAREGSINRNFATIDLSAASDSVSYELVKKLFRGTSLLRYLVATRSQKTLLPDGRLIDLLKFAPMGSALCFPIETIIFASICQFVCREHGVTIDYSVFGDDIIVPTQCVDDVMLILETLGFLVNREKSFYRSDCWFRESCGAEYCDGFNVTPIRVSRSYNHNEQLVRYDSYIQLANSAYLKGYRNLRYFFIRKLQLPVEYRKKGKTYKRSYVPLFAPNVLLSDNYTNYHTSRRWNSDLQRTEAKASALVAETAIGQDEDIRYRHWLESTADRENIGDGFQSNIGRIRPCLKDRWRNKHFEEPDQLFIDYFVGRWG
jgi:hypothetical protein